MIKIVLLLNFLTSSVGKRDKMSNLEKVTDSDLKKRLSKLIDLDDWTNECATCERPNLLHKGSCMRESKDLPEELVRIWTEFKKRMRSQV